MLDTPRRTILIVDDEALVIAAVADLCEALGHRVLRAQDGLAALPHVDAGIDLLITDIRMPNLDGPGLLRRVRAVAPTLPVIVMTGFADSPDLAAMMALKIVGVLRKPFLFDELKAMIDLAWSGESTASSPGSGEGCRGCTWSIRLASALARLARALEKRLRSAGSPLWGPRLVACVLA
jgi:CheY-like chemotaxis protein